MTLKLIRYHGHQQRIMDLFREDPNVHFVLCDTYEEVIGGSDLVISAITKVTENFVTDEYFKEGCTVIPICTMGFQNCDLFFDRVFTDEMEQIRGFKYFDHFCFLKCLSCPDHQLCFFHLIQFNDKNSERTDK